MIQANELRIGNWVFADNENTQILKIDSLNEYKGESIHRVGSVTIEMKNNIGSIGTWLHNIYPIPLTPEILEKAGFEYVKMQDWYVLQFSTPEYWMLNSSIMISIKDGKYLVHVSKHKDSVYLTSIKYIHSLQNLIYALTQTELKIKL